MSDVTVAPNAAPPPSNEVVVEQNPTGSPQPLGSQAPQKPVGDIQGSTHRPQSRREAIQAAFEKARTENPPQAAKPRIGHNNPPEATQKEKVKAEARPEDFDLRKRPTPQQLRERGEHGHFAARETQSGAEQQQQRPAAPGQQAQQQPGQRQAPQLPEGAAFRDPLPRMTEHAKAEWAKTPEPVRADVHRMHQEFAAGFQRYRADHETMKGIRNFENMAKQHGTTLQRALGNYVSMEHKLRNDVVGGLDVIVNNLNLRTPDGRKLGLRDIAFHILNQSPEQQQIVQAQNAQVAQRHQIGQLHQMVNSLAQATQQMQYERQFANTRSALDQYAEDGRHPRFDELGDLIEQEIKAGYDLETAYRRAELLRPATHAAQTRNGTQARAADRSIHGAPDGGPSNGTSRRSNGGKAVGRREAIANAIKRVNGSL